MGDRLQASLGDAFRVGVELKEGGMSRLFLATESSLNRQVVIKVLPPELSSAVSVARFKREMAVTAQLQHPHILPVLTAGSSDDLLYYVMPYVANETLRDRMNREGQLPVEFAVGVLLEVADGLAHAHSKGVVHRDLKPENILLEGEHAVLADFGIAQALTEGDKKERLTRTGLAVGTPGYMSPEQAAGGRQVDARADIYALAVVGYEMLAGSPPFEAETPQAMLMAHMSQTPRPVSEIRRATPPGVSDAIARALSKQASDRFRTAAEFRQALLAAAGPRAAASPRRRRGLPVAVATLATLALLLVVAALWPREPAVAGDPRRSLIVFPFQNRTGDAGNDWLQEASMNLLGLGLAHWEDLRVFDDERTASLMRRRDVEDPAALDFDVARSMARDARVGTLVLGDIRREGDSLAFEAKVHDVASGERVATEIVRAERSADPRPVFDSLSARILRLSGAPPGQPPGVVAQTTRSLDAYRAYVAGSQALQLFQLDSAEARFSRAVRLDSTFALAYIGLINTEGWRGTRDEDKRRRFAALAEAHSQQLPPRLRLLAQWYSAFVTGQYGQAASIAGQLVARDSGDVEAWYQLGEGLFHHGSQQFPHPDTLADLGDAFAAFRRTLALDPSYTLAYQHVTDVRYGCSLPTSPYVCIGDSVVYGLPETLDRRIGADRVARLRAEAADSLVAAGYDWVSAAPNSPRAREGLVQALLARNRHEEAAAQASILKTQGLESRGLAYEAQALYLAGRYRDAAERARAALAGVPPAELAAQFDFAYGPAIVARIGGGHVEEGIAALGSYVAELPFDPLPAVFFGVPLPKQALMDAARLLILAEASAAAGEIGRLAGAWLSSVETWVADTAGLRRILTSRSSPAGALPSPYLLAYLASRDSTILSRFLPYATAGTWQSARAHLALARGDSARARELFRRHFDPERVAIASAEDYVEVYAWADLASRLRDPRAAVRAYQALDPYTPDFTPRNVVHLGLMVRSWGERGALYQELGDRTRAIEMYRKLIEAWQDGDRHVQPFVMRAFAAIASLRGELTGPTEQ